MSIKSKSKQSFCYIYAMLAKQLVRASLVNIIIPSEQPLQQHTNYKF